jgi:hypothetical protein
MATKVGPTQFGSVDKARDKANQDVVNSKEGINQSKSQTQEELDNEFPVHLDWHPFHQLWYRFSTY